MPHVMADDALANYWMRQAMVRLRREICWIWAQEAAGQNGPRARLERVSETLELSRLWEERNHFFETDVTARYLSEQLAASAPCPEAKPAQGSFSWVVLELGLDDLARFTLGMALLASFDSSTGSVISACHHDPVRVLPSLGLIQKLWDDPARVLALGDAAHPLFRFGLLKQSSGAGSLLDWEGAFAAPAMVAQQLLLRDPPSVGGMSLLACHDSSTERLSNSARLLAYRLARRADGMQVVPLRDQPGSDSGEMLSAVAAITGHPIYEWSGTVGSPPQDGYLGSLVTLAWLKGADLLLDAGSSHHPGEKAPVEALLAEAQSLPITVFLKTSERGLSQLPPRIQLPPLEHEPLSYSERLSHWKRTLGGSGDHLAGVIEECARQFRFESRAIDAVCGTLMSLPQSLTEADLIAACRSETKVELGDLAQPVTLRFENEELILPAKQQLQFQEVLNAMAALTEVHYRWGTAKSWNEAGMSVLFAGPPGTGKTMAAEVAAIKLGLPMYRIDLSQVVNKYIGETEKNLKRVFDAADASDMVLFIDEAEAILGRRVETRDAHDRYSNLEISYLLDRMERFKGLAILATNRKKDLDEAFLRRLRYIIEFPIPEFAQRKKIWLQCIPPAVDSSRLDIDFLSRQFALAGGHIRSIVFNACLQSASAGRGGQPGGAGLSMESMLAAVKREYEKLGRSLTLEQCGPYAKTILDLDREQTGFN